MTRAQTERQGALRITQVRSQIGNQQRVVRVLVDGLGLGKIGSRVELPDNPYTRGMIAKVAHIVRVEEVEGSVTTKAKPAKKAPARKAPVTRAAKPAAPKAAKPSTAKKAAPKTAAAKAAEAAPPEAPAADAQETEE